jgi:hypothetical protein
MPYSTRAAPSSFLAKRVNRLRIGKTPIMTGATNFTTKALDPSKHELAGPTGLRLIVVMHNQYRFDAHISPCAVPAAPRLLRMRRLPPQETPARYRDGSRRSIHSGAGTPAHARPSNPWPTDNKCYTGFKDFSRTVLALLRERVPRHRHVYYDEVADTSALSIPQIFGFSRDPGIFPQGENGSDRFSDYWVPSALVVELPLGNGLILPC